MRDAEELWGGPSGDGESRGESRGRDCAGGRLKSWRQYLGQLGRPNLGSFSRGFLRKRKRNGRLLSVCCVEKRL